MTGAHKLTTQDVALIRRMFKETELSNGAIGKIFNVSDEHIRHIRLGLRYGVKNRTFIHKEELEALELDWLWEVIVKAVESKL